MKRKRSKWTALMLCVCMAAGMAGSLPVRAGGTAGAARETYAAGREEDPEGLDPSDLGEGAAPATPADAMQETGAEQNDGTSWNLKDFPGEIEILDENNKPVPKEEMEPGKEYTVHLKFRQGDLSLYMKGATRDELLESGLLTEEDLEGIGEGPWLYVPLGTDVTAVFEDGLLPDDVRVVQDGKGLLFFWDEEANNDEYEVSFKGRISEDANVEDLDIVQDSQTGHYQPTPSGDPYLKKTAGAYDPDGHTITYTVTLTTPEGQGLERGFLFEDVFGVKGHDELLPELLDGTLTVDGEPKEVTVVLDPETGKIKFEYPDDVPPGAKIEIQYTLDVTDCVNDLWEEGGSFQVDNMATVSPLTEGAWDHPLTDEAQQEVFFGSLSKTGTFRDGDFHGTERAIDWLLDIYDPYKKLYEGGFTFTDHLPEGLSFDDIIGLSFEYEEGDTSKQNYFINDDQDHNGLTWEQIRECMKWNPENNTVKFDFSSLPEEWREKLFQQDGHRLRLHIIMKYPPLGEDEENRNYRNTVEAKLPSEVDTRTAQDDVNLGPPGIEMTKEGEIVDGGNLRYTITMEVNPGISETNPASYGIIAGLLDWTTVKYAEGDIGYVDTSQAITVDSVVATYPGAEGEEETWPFYKEGTPESKAAGAGHSFDVYAVSTVSKIPNTAENGQMKNNHLKFPYTNVTAIVLNPHTEWIENDSPNNLLGYKYERVYGEWPTELADKQVTLTYTYTIDPKNAYFVDQNQNSPTINQRVPYHEADTLADYLALMGDILVNNYALAGIKSAHDDASASVNPVVPLKKEGEVKVDLAKDKKIITYTVTFHNGEKNDGALPRDAEEIVFVDDYDDKLVYVPDSLKAVRIMPNGTTKEFAYKGAQDGWPEGEISAPWKEFKAADGYTLEEDFKNQSSHYRYVFTYDMTLRPGAEMPDNASTVEVTNHANVKYQTGALKEVTSTEQFPSGVLTKEAALEKDGRLSFYIELNENGADLADAAEYLTVKDNADTNGCLELDPDSIRVERYDEDAGDWKELTEVQYEENWDGWSNRDNWMKSVGEDNKFELRVPDQTRLRVYYEYELTEAGQNQENIEFTNSVDLVGRTTVTDKKEVSFATSDIKSASSSHPATVSISKTDAVTGKPLQGAKFLLYVPNLVGDDNAEPLEEAKKVGKQTLTYEDQDLYPIQLKWTDNSGNLTMDWENIKANNFSLYALLETSAPAGYESLQEPIYFKINEDKNIQILTSELQLPVEVKASGLDVYIPNIPKGSLSVQKNVIGSEGDPAKDWHFRVELSDTSINGTFRDMAFTNGVAEFTLKNGETKTATGLPPGVTYTVTETEANQDGYGTTPSGDTGTIPEDGQASAKFLNEKPKPEPHTGSLSVTKAVTGPAGDRDKVWHFRVELSDKSVNGTYGEMTFANGAAEFTLKAGETAIATGLPAGVTYTVTEAEANRDGYSTKPSGDTGTIPEGGVAEAEFVNEKPAPQPGEGGLLVTKTVTGKAGDKKKDWHFRVELSDKGINGTYGDMTFKDGAAEFTLKHGESMSAAGLPAGVKYTVTEAEAGQDRYTTTPEGGSASGTIPDGGFARADFTNGREDPGLTVEKRVANHMPEDLAREWHFTVRLTPPAGSGINAGEITWTHSGGGSVDVRQDGDGVILTFALKHGEYVTFGNIPVGTQYHVEEAEANRPPWQTWVDPSLSPADGTVTLEEIWVRFLNERPAQTETETPSETPPETPHETESHTVPETSPETWGGTVPELPHETEHVTVPELPEESASESVPQALEKLPEDGEPPDTGDDRHPAFWLAVMALSMAVMWLTAWQAGKAARREKVPGRSRKRRRRWWEG